MLSSRKPTALGSRHCQIALEVITLNSILLGGGFACVIAAVLGGVLKKLGVNIIPIQSLKRQILLATLGLATICGTYGSFGHYHNTKIGVARVEPEYLAPQTQLGVHEQRMVEAAS